MILKSKLSVTILCLTLLYLTWGSVYLAIKFGLESFPPVMLSSFRYICAGSCFIIWAIFHDKDYSLPKKQDLKPLFIISLLMVVISGAFLNISEVYISSGVTALILGSTPIWLVVTGLIMNKEKRPSNHVLIGLSIGFIGVAILTISTSMLSIASSFGVLAVFISMSGWVIGSIYAKKYRFQLSITKQLGVQMLLAGIIMLVASYIVGEWNNFSFSNVTFKSALALIHLVTLGSLVGYTCYIWLLFNTPTHIAGSYAYAEPVLAVMLGAMFANEVFGISALFACIFIVISVILVMRK